MPLHDTRYQHWEGRHEGLWQRRLVIVANGLRGCLQNRWTRYLIAFCWLTALTQVAFLFCLGQLLVADSIVVEWAANLNPMLQTFVRGLTTWLEQHPEISVKVTQNLLFFWFTTFLFPFSLVAVALAIPHLITRDLSSNAIIIYASKALSRFDYLLGKVGIIFTLLSVTWLGPVLAAWFLGNLLAPNWHFFWHSRSALGNTLLFLLLSMVFLAVLGLGISAISRREKATVGIYILLWLVGNAFVPLGQETKPWLKHLSFNYNLRQVSVAVFRPATGVKTLQENVPVFGDVLRRSDRRRSPLWQEPELGGAWPALVVLGAACAAVVLVRTKPE